MSAPGYKIILTIYLLSDTYCALVILDLWHQLDIGSGFVLVKSGFGLNIAAA